MPTEVSKYLDPTTLTKIGGLDLKTRVSVGGLSSGQQGRTKQ